MTYAPNKLAVLLAAIVLAIACANGCNKKTPSPPPENNPPPPAPPDVPPGGVTINGTERLAWRHEATQGVSAGDLDFGAYLDGTRVTLTGMSCAPQGGTVFECTAKMPEMPIGRHELRLTSIEPVNGRPVESARSDPLILVKVAAVSIRDRTREPDAAPTGDAPDGAGREFAIEPVAAGADAIADLAVAGDGRIFAAERRGRMFVAGRGGTPAVALDLADVETGGARGLFSIALHPEFEKNGLVYLVYAARTPDGAVYRLSRGREVGGRIGEIAALLDAAPAPPGSWSIIRFGPDGRLYAAIGDDRVRSGRAASYSGKLLRLNDDGTAAVDNTGRSPILTGVPGVPSGLAWARDVRVLQLDAAGRYELRSNRDGRDETTLVWEAGHRPAALAFVPDGSRPGAGHLFVAALDGGVRRLAWPLAARIPRPTEGPIAAHVGAVRALAVAADGSVYLGTANGDVRAAGAAAFHDVVVRLTPQPRAGR